MIVGSLVVFDSHGSIGVVGAFAPGITCVECDSFGSIRMIGGSWVVFDSHGSIGVVGAKEGLNMCSYISSLLFTLSKTAGVRGIS